MPAHRAIQTLPGRKVAAYRGDSIGLRVRSGIGRKSDRPSTWSKSNPMSHEKILIVADEPSERSGLADLVTSWGFRVETARDGAEGLDKATQWSPSIVITDLKMPSIGGIEVLDTTP